MTKQCTHRKKNGQQCRATALWGSDPPRCVAHRQDDGPKPPLFQKGNQYARLSATHGFYSRSKSGPKSIEEATAEVLAKHEQLATFINLQTDSARLVTLYRLYASNLDRLLALLEQYQATTGQSADTLFEAANGEPKARLREELKSIEQELKTTAAPTYPTTKKRSPRYWLIYNFIVDYIRQYRVGPTRREIKQACHISSNNVLDYWFDKLEQDGLIVRRPGVHRGIALANTNPDQGGGK